MEQREVLARGTLPMEGGCWVGRPRQARTWDSISRSVGSHRWALSMESTVKGDHSSGVDGELEAVVHWSELARQGASCASQLHAQSWLCTHLSQYHPSNNMINIVFIHIL